MSRISITTVERCKYAELDEFYSSRGELRISYICHHDENEGCFCMMNRGLPADCEFCRGEEETQQEEPAVQSLD
jgi:hypothetical protein